jgi:hypothetical protein
MSQAVQPEHSDFYPPDEQADFLSFGLDHTGHLLRIFVDGQHRWIRVGFRDVESMKRAQKMFQSGVFRSVSMLQPHPDIAALEQLPSDQSTVG